MDIRMDREWRNLDRKEACLQAKLKHVEMELREMNAIYKRDCKKTMFYFVCVLSSILLMGFLWFSEYAFFVVPALMGLTLVAILISFFYFGNSFLGVLSDLGLKPVAMLYYGKARLSYKIQKRELEQERDDLCVKIMAVQRQKEKMENPTGILHFSGECMF